MARKGKGRKGKGEAKKGKKDARLEIAKLVLPKKLRGLVSHPKLPRRGGGGR